MLVVRRCSHYSNVVADQDLFDVHLWIKSVAESADIEDRATLRQMGEWVEEEKDGVNKSLDHAKRLNHKMSEISQSLVSSARSDHKSLRQKLKDQYFSFQAQLTTSVASLEEEETKRRFHRHDEYHAQAKADDGKIEQS